MFPWRSPSLMIFYHLFFILCRYTKQSATPLSDIVNAIGDTFNEAVGQVGVPGVLPAGGMFDDFYVSELLLVVDGRRVRG